MTARRREAVTVEGLTGLRIFIVEDESLITMLIEDALADMGCAIAGIASNVDEAMSKVSSLEFDAAILDVNLNGSQTYPVADALAKKGIPFVLSTGYGVAGIPETYQGMPVLGKPFEQSDLQRALRTALNCS